MNWNYEVNDYLLVNRDTEEVQAVSGNTDFYDSEYQDKIPDANFYVVQVVKRIGKKPWVYLIKNTINSLKI